jgi:hypothetical protein
MRTLLTLGLLGCLAGTASAEHLNISLDTTPKGTNYAPTNILAVWIEDAAGNFVATIDRWSGVRTVHLVRWRQAAGQGDLDAVSGATRPNHNQSVVISWDLTDRAGQVVPDGTYNIQMEMADENSNTIAQNHQATFSFDKSGQSSLQMAQQGGFDNVVIDYIGPDNAQCNNGVLDPGETCDPPGSCPTECPAPSQICTEVVLSGSQANCNAECVTQAISMCVNDDGCCPTGCDSRDSDCTGAVEFRGGCSLSGSGNAPVPLTFVLVACAIVWGRRSRASAA